MGYIKFGDVNRDEVTPAIWLGHQWDQSGSTNVIEQIPSSKKMEQIHYYGRFAVRMFMSFDVILEKSRGKNHEHSPSTAWFT